MRFKIFSIAIVLVAAILGCYGSHLKYDVLKPMGLYQDKSIFELPFLMYSDDFLRFMVDNADEILAQQPPQTQPPISVTPPVTTPPTTTVPPTTTLCPTQPGFTTAPVVPPVTGTQPGIPPATTIPMPPTTTAPVPTPPVTEPTKPKDEPNFDFPGDSVPDSWFDNTLFIGDSRVVGLREYARSGNADYFCGVGMTVFSYKGEEHWDKNYSKQTLESLLNSKQYDKIIVNFGLNECGYPDASFQYAYRAFVDMLRQKQPDAKIILQGIMSVTRKKAQDGYWMTPSHIAKRSAYIQSLTDGVNIFYIDCNPYFTDSEGYLYSSLTNDGYHPTGTGYRHWRDWIGYAVGTLGI